MSNRKENHADSSPQREVMANRDADARANRVLGRPQDSGIPPALQLLRRGINPARRASFEDAELAVRNCCNNSVCTFKEECKMLWDRHCDQWELHKEGTNAPQREWTDEERYCNWMPTLTIREVLNARY